MDILKSMPNLRVLYIRVIGGKEDKVLSQTLTAALQSSGTWMIGLCSRRIGCVRKPAKGMQDGGLKAAQEAERAEIKRQRERREQRSRGLWAFSEMIKEAKKSYIGRSGKRTHRRSWW